MGTWNFLTQRRVAIGNQPEAKLKYFRANQKLQLRNLYLLDLNNVSRHFNAQNSINLLLLTCLATFTLPAVPSIDATALAT